MLLLAVPFTASIITKRTFLEPPVKSKTSPPKLVSAVSFLTKTEAVTVEFELILNAWDILLKLVPSVS